MSRLLASILVLGGLAASARAQSVNINFTADPNGAPASSYGAAGIPGTWNAVTGIDGPTFHFVDIHGGTTNVTMTQSPTEMDLSGGDDAALSGDDAKLLNTGIFTTSAETCLTFAGFNAGDYEILVYAYSPSQPTIKSRTRQDDAPSTIDVGGAWSGAHVEGITYARYPVTVTNGNLPAHSGLAPNMPSAMLNGIQIRLLTDVIPPNDAGVGGDGGGSNNESGDAGITSGGSHHSGCSVGGGGSGAGMLLIALGLVRRRRR